jgi:hypothetical protein
MSRPPDAGEMLSRHEVLQARSRSPYWKSSDLSQRARRTWCVGGAPGYAAGEYEAPPHRLRALDEEPHRLGRAWIMVLVRRRERAEVEDDLTEEVKSLARGHQESSLRRQGKPPPDRGGRVGGDSLDIVEDEEHRPSAGQGSTDALHAVLLFESSLRGARLADPRGAPRR